MKSVQPEIYNKDYYLSVCLGAEEFKKSSGKKLHKRLELLLAKIDLKKNMRVLDLGCGRGDITLYLAKHTKEAFGIDYSKDAIAVSQNVRKTFPPSIRKKTTFMQMDAKQLQFPDNFFDCVIAIDIFEHLYKDELEIAMKEIKRVLKPEGLLFVHTGTNRVLYDYVYPYYIYPINRFVTWVDKTLRHVTYDSLPKDPRTAVEKEQHVNEPTFFYLTDLFKRFMFEGKIMIEIGYIKEIRGIKTILYNAVLCLYPLSKLFPLNLLFGWVFICTMYNKKVT